jgi:hypothetical protein
MEQAGGIHTKKDQTSLWAGDSEHELQKQM